MFLSPVLPTLASAAAACRCVGVGCGGGTFSSPLHFSSPHRITSAFNCSRYVFVLHPVPVLLSAGSNTQISFLSVYEVPLPSNNPNFYFPQSRRVQERGIFWRLLLNISGARPKYDLRHISVSPSTMFNTKNEIAYGEGVGFVLRHAHFDISLTLSNESVQ